MSQRGIYQLDMFHKDSACCLWQTGLKSQFALIRNTVVAELDVDSHVLYWVPQTRDRLPRKSVQLDGESDGHQICPNALYIDYTHQIYPEIPILDYFVKSVPTMFTWIINQLSVSKATTWSTLENCTRGLMIWVTVSDVYFSSKLGRLECPPPLPSLHPHLNW